MFLQIINSGVHASLQHPGGLLALYLTAKKDDICIRGRLFQGCMHDHTGKDQSCKSNGRQNGSPNEEKTPQKSAGSPSLPDQCMNTALLQTVKEQTQAHNKSRHIPYIKYPPGENREDEYKDACCAREHSDDSDHICPF